MNETNKLLHIELREAVELVPLGQFHSHVTGTGYIADSMVVIEREDGSKEYYPWGNILAVRTREIQPDEEGPQSEEAEVIEGRIKEMTQRMLVA